MKKRILISLGILAVGLVVVILTNRAPEAQGVSLEPIPRGPSATPTVGTIVCNPAWSANLTEERD